MLCVCVLAHYQTYNYITDYCISFYCGFFSDEGDEGGEGDEEGQSGDAEGESRRNQSDAEEEVCVQNMSFTMCVYVCVYVCVCVCIYIYIYIYMYVYSCHFDKVVMRKESHAEIKVTLKRRGVCRI